VVCRILRFPANCPFGTAQGITPTLQHPDVYPGRAPTVRDFFDHCATRKTIRQLPGLTRWTSISSFGSSADHAPVFTWTQHRLWPRRKCRAALNAARLLGQTNLPVLPPVYSKNKIRRRTRPILTLRHTSTTLAPAESGRMRKTRLAAANSQLKCVRLVWSISEGQRPPPGAGESPPLSLRMA